jgi:hypothetical protein
LLNTVLIPPVVHPNSSGVRGVGAWE